MKNKSEHQNNIKNIFFIGRLESEKGIEIVRDIILESQNRNKSYVYHIFGEWRFFEEFISSEKFNKNFVKLYGRVEQEVIFQELSQKADILLMPSLFLETFGLVALEAWEMDVPVIGFKKWWLSDFISSECALDEKNPIDSFFKILEKIEKQENTFVDISRFSYDSWKNNLEQITKNFQKILLIHDYAEKIGGAEMYVFALKKELEKIWKTVKLVSSTEGKEKVSRRKLFFLSLFSKKMYKKISTEVRDFQPDLIWSHTVLRAIGAGGMKAIKNTNIPHYLMHHDLGLFSVQPSKISQVSQIPKNLHFGIWMRDADGLISLIKIFIKWILVSRIWKQIPKNTTHIFPSMWMQEATQDYPLEKFFIFPHTVFKK